MDTKKNHPLLNINFGVIPVERYRGCLVNKIIGGWEVFGIKCLTPEKVDESIDNACSSLSESIVVINRGEGEMECTNFNDENNEYDN